jgi:CheY-like chemotaxis protein
MRDPSPLPSQNAVRILMVDDNEHGLVARTTVLHDLGYSITSLTNSEEALERFAEESFDLVITDYRMPKIHGLELIRRIKNAKPEVPVILISGFVEPLGLDGSNTGADAVIAKSASEVTHMVRAVSRLLSHRLAKKPPGSHRVLSKTQAKSG